MHSNLQTIASGLVAILTTGALGDSSKDPCAKISELSKQTGSGAEVSPQLAAECLISMPFESNKAVAFVDEYAKYLEFQSDLEILAKPPASYLSNRVDLRAGLQGIRSAAAQGSYSSQYEFDSDISDLINSANDGHLSATLCSLQAFTFEAPGLILTSLSTDGVTPPQLYLTEDAMRLAAGAENVSPVAYINGVGAVSTVESQAWLQLLQDPDARYNQLVNNLLVDGSGADIGASFTVDSVWRGIDSYNLTFANQTTTSFEVVAVVADGFDYASGSELYEGLCGTAVATQSPEKRSPTTTTPLPSSSAVVNPSSTFTPPPKTYPVPIMREKHNLVVGYYPEEPGLEDVAVLGVPTFETETDTLDAMVQFAEVANYFVGNATKDGKKKIIIDVQNNGGGVVDSGFALFSIFFPNETLYSSTRFRAHDAMNFMGTIFNAGDNPDNSTIEATGLTVNDLVKPDQESTFKDWAELFGPYKAGGVPSSAVVAEFDFADDANPFNNPINTDGLGGDLNATTPPFAPEDIIVLTDGRCSSTCTIFTDHMVSKGVSTVALGGRPRPDPMQAIGGIKGSQVLDLSYIDSYSSMAVSQLNQSIAAGKPLLSKENITRFAEVMPIPLADFPLKFGGGTINYRNTYTKDNDQIPTQFVYEAATCHLFYTPKTVTSPAASWALAANATWGSGSCVGGVQPDTSLGSQSLDDSSNSADSDSNSVSSPGTHRALGLLLALGSGMA
ncbi:hypothetical protein PISL3812_05483 [Talaromyces islandicus]|uniref:Uncharacterized protein n=1 Tax=Talaromyces islandicus TaxID=28573 RepID=A0A0U1LYP2_TALIS|nr:hypothetical protein PISL3812_05483 [Talaromyces islandicus]